METLWHGVEDNKIRVLVFTPKSEFSASVLLALNAQE